MLNAGIQQHFLKRQPRGNIPIKPTNYNLIRNFDKSESVSKKPKSERIQTKATIQAVSQNVKNVISTSITYRSQQDDIYPSSETHLTQEFKLEAHANLDNVEIIHKLLKFFVP